MRYVEKNGILLFNIKSSLSNYSKKVEFQKSVSLPTTLAAVPSRLQRKSQKYVVLTQSVCISSVSGITHSHA